MTSYELYVLSVWVTDFLQVLYPLPVKKDLWDTELERGVDEYRRKTARFRVTSAVYRLSAELFRQCEKRWEEEK